MSRSMLCAYAAVAATVGAACSVYGATIPNPGDTACPQCAPAAGQICNFSGACFYDPCSDGGAQFRTRFECNTFGDFVQDTACSTCPADAGGCIGDAAH